MAGLFPAFGQNPNDYVDMRQREQMWKYQMEFSFQQLGLQLRASHSENQRLREELKEALERKESSRYGTPEGQSSSVLKEDGARAQQGSVKQEDGARAQQSSVKQEDGARAQQGSVKQEDGARAQQGSVNQEDGARARQGAVREEEGAGARQEQSEDDQSSEEESKNGAKESVDKKSLKIMLKLMEGMQELQRQIVVSKDDARAEEVEVVRFMSDLPKLAEWSPDTAPIDFGDWVICLHPHMADLSSTSEMWWDLTLSTARAWYDNHMKLSPIQRLTNAPQTTPELQQKKWSRLERRASSLLLGALPESLKEEVIASKAITALGILAKAMLQFQPGGLTERSAILAALESPTESTTVASAILQLRRWIRWKRRALEVGVSLPDSSILMKGLGRLVKRIVTSHPDLNFRLSLVKSSLMVDTVPTLETVTQYSEHLLAELEQMGQQAKRKEVAAETQLKVRKFEETSNGKSDEKARPKGKPQEEFEAKRKPCRFFLTDAGCRRGRSCPFGHQLDGDKRCWTCGAKDHMATTCPTAEDQKPRAAKIGSKSVEKDAKSTPSSPEKAEEQSEAAESGGDDSMKNLLDEASRMLKAMGEGDVKEKRQKKENSGEKIQGLQRQLDELRKASLKPFRISKLCQTSSKGLLDSGATHPLRGRRKGERFQHLPKVKVTLAGDKEIFMSLTPTGVIVGDEGTEPIVPMGLLTTVLGCEVSWKPEGLHVWHPTMGKLEVKVEDGCPMVTQNVALQLIEQIEAKAKMVAKSLRADGDSEVKWLKRLVQEHPALQGVPEEIKEHLVEVPAENLIPLGNRRRRKLWRSKGMLVHVFSGEDSGYTLGRAFHEIGGDRRLLHELDVLHQKSSSDLSVKGEAYPLLLRAALDGWVKAWIGGPPCRTRSVLRHLDVPGEEMPRRLRSWEGGEWGIEGLSNFEKAQLFQDDLLMMRFLVLYIISETMRRAEDLEAPTTFIIEQPAPPGDRPEVVSWWRTPQWKGMEEIYGLHQQRINQSEFGATSTKPTTIGGNVPLQVPLPGRKGVPRDVAGKTKEEIFEGSRRLARWPPLMMRSIATALQTCTLQEPVKIRTVSWQEHVQAGHTPFRKDCRVCQEASARDAQHKRQKLPPKAGVLSVDISGPFRPGDDLHGRTAKYLLAGSFTWPARVQEQELTEEEIPEVQPEAPVIDDDVEEPQEEEADGSDEPPEVEQPPLEEEPEESEERKNIKIEVTKLCEPLQSRRKEDVLRGIINMYMRLRADGYVVTQLHSDLGAEFKSSSLQKWCESRTILRTYTSGDQPQMNGRCEATIQHLKAAIRRTLHGAGASFERWPLAARFINEKLRQKQVGKEIKTPPFLAPVLVRKRYWRSRELEPTQETVSYICPSWVHHGHWVERSDGSQSLTKMVMHGVTEPPKLEDWIGIEDALNPIEERRRLRHKASIYKVEAEEGQLHALPMEIGLQEGQTMSEGEEEDWRRKERVQRLVEEEMVEAMSDDVGTAGHVLDAIVKIKEIFGQEKGEEILQTRIVSQAEVRRNIEDWREPIERELVSLFETKGALKKVSEAEVKRLLEEDKAELIPSKMVFTVKPEQGRRGGKYKARLVACGNFSEREDSQDLFAGGATAVALRAALTVAAQMDFLGCTIDVRTAFLNAPMVLAGDRGEQHEQKRAFIRPPALLVTAGLAKPDEFYEAVMALYGYKESPRLWSDYRDNELTAMKIDCANGVLTLQQMVTEPNMWRLMLKTSGPGRDSLAEEFVGLLLVYVDDLLILGSSEVVEAVVAAIQSKWETSTPEMIGMSKEVRFLGAELWRREDGVWMITQANYIKDLLKRNLGDDPQKWQTRKIPLLKEPEIFDDPEQKTPANVKEAQRVVGELVWITARTRPDLAFVISKMASMITKAPVQVVQLAKTVWQYLAATVHQGLIFKNVRGERQLNIYTDASYSDVSFGCHLVLWGTSLLLWKAGKQPIQAASTAESELVEVLEGALAGEAVKVVLEEALDVVSRSFSFTDSSAALSIIAGESGSWRTRHLRKRAHILRSKVFSGEWMLRHVAGSEMPADLGTKVLSVLKFDQHKRAMGMFLETKEVFPEEIKELNKEKGVGMSREAKERALQVIIFVTQMAMAQGAADQSDRFSSRIWENSVVPIETQKSQFFLIVIVAVIFAIGVVTGICIMGLILWHRVDKVTMVRYKGSLVDVPAFLYKAFEGRDTEVRRPSFLDARSTSAGVCGSTRRIDAADPSGAAGAAAGGPSSAAGAAAGGPPSAAGAAAGGSSSAADPSSAAGAADSSRAAHLAAGGSSGAADSLRAAHLAAGGSSGAADSSRAAHFAAGGSTCAAHRPMRAAHFAAGGSSSAAGTAADGQPHQGSLRAADGAAGGSSSAAGAAAGGSSGAADAPEQVRAGLRNRMQDPREGMSPLYTTPYGGKYHSDRRCHGLRHASEILLTPRCHRCGPAAEIPHYQLWAISHGYDLHTSYEHCRDAGSNNLLRLFKPCAICCPMPQYPD